MPFKRWADRFRERDQRKKDNWFRRAELMFRERGVGPVVERCRFLESQATPKPAFETVGPHRFRVVMLEEGLGNLHDGFYYTKDALRSARVLLDGAKIYADHPTKTEEEDRPERSVRDVIGHFEDLKIVESEKDGRASLTATAIVLPDDSYRWARALMRSAIDYSQKFPDKNFIGLSINAGGSAERVGTAEFLKTAQIPESARPKILKAMENGLDTIRVVKNIQSAISCDLVTEPGAGGRVLKIEQ